MGKGSWIVSKVSLLMSMRQDKDTEKTLNEMHFNFRRVNFRRFDVTVFNAFVAIKSFSGFSLSFLSHLLLCITRNIKKESYAIMGQTEPQRAIMFAIIR